MNILITDFVFENAHKDMNINFIRAISKIGSCCVVSADGYYRENERELSSIGVRIKHCDIPIRRGIITGRKTSLELMECSARILNTEKYDAVIVLCFETTCIPLRLHDFGKHPLILFYHRNIDELSNALKKRIFKIYKNKVYHVVFEEYFKEYLQKTYDIDDKALFVIPHPAREQIYEFVKYEYDCVGLCNSNDESFVQAAIDNDKQLSGKNLKILLRSKTQEYRGKAVVVIKGYLEKNEYDRYLNSAKSIFVPFPPNYNYRLSGSIYDGLSRKKKVFTTSKFYSDDYSKRYPGTCEYVNTIDQLIDAISRQNRVINGSFDTFLLEHSLERVSTDIQNMLFKILGSQNIFED